MSLMIVEPIRTAKRAPRPDPATVAEMRRLFSIFGKRADQDEVLILADVLRSWIGETAWLNPTDRGDVDSLTGAFLDAMGKAQTRRNSRAALVSLAE